MALSGLGLFMLEACAGTAFLLLFFPPDVLGRGFFSLHGSLAAIFAVLALLVRPPGLPFPVLVAGIALLAFYTLAAHAGKAGRARPLLAAGTACAAWCLGRVALVAPREGGDAWTVVGALAGGLFFGAVLVIMNLGHWYLVSRSIPFALLARGAAVFAGLAVFRTVYLAVAMAAQRHSEGVQTLLSLERDALFFLFRVLWGIAGPLALSYFIWRTAELKSNQAATGLLYVALIFVLIGELLSSYLTVATGFPA
jgi:protein NrfD